MTAATTARRPPPPAVTVAVLVVAATVVAVIAALRWQMIDLDVYRKGAWAFLHGRDPYGPNLPGPFLPYTYTPFSTVFFAPFDLIPRAVARAAITGVTLGLLFVSVRLVLSRTVTDPRIREVLLPLAGVVTVAAALSEPVRATLSFGQINVVLMAMVLIDLLVLPRTRFAGALIGVAAGIKLIPLVYVVYLVVTRRFRAAVTAGISGALTIAIGAVLLPHPTYTYFFDGGLSPNHVGGVPYIANQSFEGMFSRWAHGADAAHPYWLVAAALTMAFGMFTAVNVRRTHGEVAGIWIAALTGLLVSPISWSHHWVWWILPAIVLGERAWRLRTGRAYAAVVAWALPFYLSPIWWVPYRNNREYRHTWWQSILGNTYVLVGVTAMVVAGWRPLVALIRRVTAPAHRDATTLASSEPRGSR